jgi:hypothetical protein
MRFIRCTLAWVESPRIAETLVVLDLKASGSKAPSLLDPHEAEVKDVS